MDGEQLAALRAGIEGLEGRCHDGEGLGCRADPCVENVSRAEVLALLDESDEDQGYDPASDQRFRAQLERDGAKIGVKMPPDDPSLPGGPIEGTCSHCFLRIYRVGPVWGHEPGALVRRCWQAHEDADMSKRWAARPMVRR